MKWRCKVSHFVPTQAIIHNVFKYFLKKDSPYYAEYFFEPVYFTELAQNIVKPSGPNVSTTPLQQWGFRKCLPFSWTTLRGKHCRHPIAVMGVVDTFGLSFEWILWYRILWKIICIMSTTYKLKMCQNDGTHIIINILWLKRWANYLFVRTHTYNFTVYMLAVHLECMLANNFTFQSN